MDKKRSPSPILTMRVRVTSVSTTNALRRSFRFNN
ncbi:hypothetical protein ACHAXS_002147, partial [Conticribra weissflogii]